MKDGGPAFPAQHFDLADGEHGMTLRDWLAGMAMQGLMDAAMPLAKIAEEAYQMADAMIQERSKT